MGEAASGKQKTVDLTYTSISLRYSTKSFKD